jgi:outer membrane immunogenic protein
MRTILLAAASLLASAPAVAQTADFSGPRIEAQIGVDRFGLSIEADDGVDSGSLEGDESGLVYGVEAGYDFAIGTSGLTVGPLVGISFSNTERCEEVFGNDRACGELKRDVEAGVRAGGPLGSRGFFYAKVSYVNGKAEGRYTNADDPSLNGAASVKRDGLRFGAGIEYALGGPAYAKVEYRFTAYKGYEAFVEGFDVDLDIDRHQVLGGVGFRF